MKLGFHLINERVGSCKYQDEIRAVDYAITGSDAALHSLVKKIHHKDIIILIRRHRRAFYHYIIPNLPAEKSAGLAIENTTLIEDFIYKVLLRLLAIH